MVTHKINRAEHHVGYWCSRITRAMRSQLDARLVPWGLNFSEAMILLELDRHGPLSISQLGAELAHTHPSILKQVNTLSQAGFVTCSASAEDRRVRTVELTPASKPLIFDILDIISAVNREAVAGLPPPALEQLLSYLHLIYGNLTIAHNHAHDQHPARVTGLPSSHRTSK